MAVFFKGTQAKARNDLQDGPWVSVLFQNVTEWGPKAELAITSARCKDEVLMIAEHRLMGEQGKRTLDGHARRQGWKALASPAKLKKVEATGGEAIFFKQHLAIEAHAPQFEALPSTGKGFVMALWRLGGRVLLLASVYVRSWVPDEAKTIRRALAARIQALQLPVLIGGDWNQSPEELRATGWLKKLGLWVVSDGQPTCLQGKGSCIDYFVASREALALVGGIGVDRSIGLKPHLGVRVWLKAKPAQVWHRTLSSPASWIGQPHNAVAQLVKMKALSWDELWKGWQGVSEEQRRLQQEHLAHFAHWPAAWRSDAQTLDEGALRWSATAELQLASAIGWDPKCFGHGGFPRTVWQQSLPKRQAEEEGEKGSVLHSASVLSARVSELADLVAKQEWHEGRCSRILRWLRRASFHEDIENAWSCSVGVCWRVFRKRPLSFEKGRLDSAAVELSLLVKEKRRLHAASCRQAFAKWVEDLIAEPKKAHRWTKLGSSMDDDLWQQLQKKQAMPQEAAMANRVGTWSRHWQQHQGEWAQLQEEIEKLRAEVQLGVAEDEIDLVEQQMLDEAISSYGVDKARGLDGWSTALLRQIDQQGREDLCQLLRACETTQMWPSSWMAAEARFLDKPDGSERPIMLLNLFYRLWVKARGGDVSAWEREYGSEHDTAIAGSSALRAAMCRAMQVESAVALGQDVVLTFFDMAKFYDSISLLVLITLAREVHYPPLMLLMAILQYMAPRWLKAKGHVSEPVKVFGTIAPGCGQAVALTRPLLHSILSWAASVSPLSTLEAFVDDLVLKVEGPARLAGYLSARITGQLIEKLQDRKLIISETKTKVVCSSAVAAEATKAALAERGIHLTIANDARDLGVDTSAGKRRAVKVANGRLAAGGRRMLRIRQLARTRKKAKVLYKPASAQAAWGQQVMGLSGTALKEIRRQALRACGFKAGGLCISSALMALFGERGDPAIRTLCQQVTLWMAAWRTRKSLRTSLYRCWEKLRDQASDNDWRQAKGPGVALILALRRAGWEAIGPDKWLDPRGDWWIAEKQAANNELLLDRLVQDAQDEMLPKMAGHWQGEGMQEGVDRTAAARLLDKHKGKQSFNLLVRIVAGGLWGAQRRHLFLQEEDRPSPLCKRCAARVVDTDFHLCFDCEDNEQLKEKDQEAFADKVTLHAHRYGSQYPCFVTRGLIPRGLTQVPQPSDGSKFFTEPALPEDQQRFKWDGVAEVFSDGSGGEHTADRRLRRSGFSFVVEQPQHQQQHLEAEEPPFDCEPEAPAPAPADEQPKASHAKVQLVNGGFDDPEGDDDLAMDCEAEREDQTLEQDFLDAEVFDVDFQLEEEATKEEELLHEGLPGVPGEPTEEEEATLKPIFCVWGTLPGEIQSVGRAELFAAIRILEMTEGQMVLWTDYKALVTGYEKGRNYTIGCSRMADLWYRFWAAVDARPGGPQYVTIKKIKAHQSLAAVREGSAPCTLRQWLGNRKADSLARIGADEHAVSDEVVKRVKLHTEMATLFLRRMLVVMKHVLDSAPQTPPRPKRIAKREKWPRRRERLKANLRASGHDLERRTLSSGKALWFCTKCHAGRLVGPGLESWLKHKPCRPVGADGVGSVEEGREVAVCPQAHFSHRLALRGEVVICEVCGFYSGPGTTIRDLRWPCTGTPSHRAEENWRLCREGTHPRSRRPMSQLGQSELLTLIV